MHAVNADLSGEPLSRSDWSAAPVGAEAHRELTRRRVGYFSAVFLVVSLVFYARNAAAIALLERKIPPFSHPAFLLHTAAIGVHAGAWFATRARGRSLEALRFIDAAGLLLSLIHI